MTARVVSRLDVNGADLSAILSGGKIGAGGKVRVIESQPCRPGCEGDAAHAMRGNERRSFFRSAVDIDRDGLSMPV
jgi:hypothetical protein